MPFDYTGRPARELLHPSTSGAIGAARTEILSVTWTDSTDGRQRTYVIVCGTQVDTLHVYHRLWPIGQQGDPYNFLTAQFTADLRNVIIIRNDGTNAFTFTLDHPSRAFQRPIILVARQGAPTFQASAQIYKLMLDPAPPALSARLKATVVNAAADVSADITAGISDWPVTVRVYEGAPDSTPLVTATLYAPGLISKVSHPVLGARALPSNQVQSWWVKLANVALEEFWFGPETADRDPLPNGTVTVDDYRATPILRMIFDLNTDSIRVTIPGGRTKTWSTAQLVASGSPVTYTVGDLLDDSTVETAIGADVTTASYKVEYQGGGSWVTMYQGALHGAPSSPPTARIRVVPNVVGSTEDVFVQVESTTNEHVRVYFRDGEDVSAPVYGLVAGAGDSTPLFVARGTEVGPANFLKNIDGSGSPSAKLSAIPLTRDQIKRVSVQMEGQASGVKSSWIPVALSLLQQPWNESVAVDWREATGTLIVTVVAGARSLFETVQIADNATFTSPQTQTGTITDGQTIIYSFALTAAQRGKQWYGRATPNSHADGSGLGGTWQADSVFVPSLFTVLPSLSEASGNAVVQLAVSDPGSVLNPAWTDGVITGAFHWEILDGDGVRHTVASTTVPAGGATTGTYQRTYALDEKHAIQINAYAHLVDGSTQSIGSWTFDADKISDNKATASYTDDIATITAIFDSDTQTGAAGARYRVDGGSWVNITVNATTLIGTFTVTLSGSAEQTIDVQGKSLNGTYGRTTTLKVDKYIPIVPGAGPGPSLTIQTVTTNDTVTMTYTFSGTLTVSVNGGTFGAATASPWQVARHLTLEQTYEFKVSQNGQILTRLVQIPPIMIQANITVTINANGAWQATIDGPAVVSQYKWQAQTGSFPADAAVITGPSNVNSGNKIDISGGTLTFGDTIFITAVPYTAGGTSLAPVHGRGSYTNFTATKTLNYPASGTIGAWSDSTYTYDSDGALNPDDSPTTGYPGFVGTWVPNSAYRQFFMIPAGTTGVTITSVTPLIYYVSPGNLQNTSWSFERRVGTTVTTIGIVQNGTAITNVGWQTPAIGLTENTVGRAYSMMFDVGWNSKGATKYGGVAIQYTMGDPKQAA